MAQNRILLLSSMEASSNFWSFSRASERPTDRRHDLGGHEAAAFSERPQLPRLRKALDSILLPFAIANANFDT